MSTAKKITGKKFGRLSCIEIAGRDKHKNIQWVCKCDCGGEAIVVTRDLMNGHTQSCGCLQEEKAKLANYKHGKKGTRLYNIWQGMKRRCIDKNIPGYKNYGGRGITICDEWIDDFLPFHDWAMANGYTEGLTIERIDNDGDYSPDNCTWIPKGKQSRNTRANRPLKYKGETKLLTDWARLYGIDTGTLANRISRDWPLEKALTQPVRQRGGSE